MTILSVLLLFPAIGCQPAADDKAESDAAATLPELQADLQLADDAMLDEYLAQYAPYEMFYDASGLPEDEMMDWGQVCPLSRTGVKSAHYAFLFFS